MNLQQTHSIFPVPDIEKTTEFYTTKLGFRAERYLTCTEPHVCLYKDNIEIILTDSKNRPVVPNRILYGYGYDIYIITYPDEKLIDYFKNQNLKIIKESTSDYNNKEIVIEDIDGRWLCFGVKIK